MFKDRDNNFGSGVSDAGYCLSARCADGSHNRSHDDYHHGSGVRGRRAGTVIDFWVLASKTTANVCEPAD